MMEDKRCARTASTKVPNVTIPKNRRLEEIINVISAKMIANPSKPIVRYAKKVAIKSNMFVSKTNSTNLTEPEFANYRCLLNLYRTITDDFTRPLLL
jgi:protein-tyrosine-phosphatase